MERFYYTIKQKLDILELVQTGQLFRLHTQFPQVTQKQINEWSQKEEEMKALPLSLQKTKLTLHKGPPMKYAELYQFLYQIFKDLREEREPVTVDFLIEIAQQEDRSIEGLTPKGKTSLVRRFMELFNLSIRIITGTAGYRPEQASLADMDERDYFIRRFRQIIAQKDIPIDSIFNFDQTGILYENVPNRTVDYAGLREIPVKTQNGEKKRLTLFSLMSASGKLQKQMIVMKGVPNARIHAEISELDDESTIHSCQENAWTSQEILEEWHERVWKPIAEEIIGPKFLLLDSYPIHVDSLNILRKYNTTVLFVPAGMTFNSQPLDAGFFKELKNELKKLWVSERPPENATEREKRFYISTQLKTIWEAMRKKNFIHYWEKADLVYPHWMVQNHSRGNFEEDSSLFESNNSTLMEIEVDNTQ